MGVNNTSYPEIFKTAAGQIDKGLLADKHMEVATGMYGSAYFLKLYKKAWANAGQDALTAESRIFFSIWVDDASLEQREILYNIHALKLRKLKGYAIESRKFAETFRRSFKPYEQQWPNVSTAFGPLTLMQGWLTVDMKDAGNEILELANRFLGIEQLIDDTLEQFRR